MDPDKFWAAFATHIHITWTDTACQWHFKLSSWTARACSVHQKLLCSDLSKSGQIDGEEKMWSEHSAPQHQFKHRSFITCISASGRCSLERWRHMEWNAISCKLIAKRDCPPPTPNQPPTAQKGRILQTGRKICYPSLPLLGLYCLISKPPSVILIKALKR